eukprot:TRINITY_DN7678_c0_g1_i1.p1 TRINITY_DN7678_c0_g1~~TRINITY_DN7678_c0_g1_i1.p1  ORF type:complete len:347 (-),score=100.45 TRINITY_DN7678_c0_g1_i1:190-1170(-)
MAAIGSPVIMKKPRSNIITEQIYRTNVWPDLKKSLENILSDPSAPFSQLDLYRVVYEICCAKRTLALFNDLSDLLDEFINKSIAFLSQIDKESFLTSISNSFKSYKKSMECFSAIFLYLERVNPVEPTLQNYCLSKYKSVLSHVAIESKLLECLSELLQVAQPPLSFPSIPLEGEIKRGEMEEIQMQKNAEIIGMEGWKWGYYMNRGYLYNNSFPSPSIVSTIVNGLYHLNKEIILDSPPLSIHSNNNNEDQSMSGASDSPSLSLKTRLRILFSLYIPNIIPSRGYLLDRHESIFLLHSIDPNFKSLEVDGFNRRQKRKYFLLQTT